MTGCAQNNPNAEAQPKHLQTPSGCQHKQQKNRIRSSTTSTIRLAHLRCTSVTHRYPRCRIAWRDLPTFIYATSSSPYDCLTLGDPRKRDETSLHTVTMYQPYEGKQRSARSLGHGRQGHLNTQSMRLCEAPLGPNGQKFWRPVSSKKRQGMRPMSVISLRTPHLY